MRTAVRQKIYVFQKTYDSAGRMLTGTMGSGSSTLSYDGFGRRDSIVHSDGASGSFQRDLLNRITQVTWTGPTPISESLNFDTAGNPNEIARDGGNAWNMTFDAIDQVISSTGLENRSWQLDAHGNALQDSVNGAGSFISNFLTSNGVASYLADPNGFGDLVQETKAGVTKNYVYRADGRISGFQSGSTQVAYYRDALGRLAAKAINDGTNAYTQSFAYIGRSHVLLQSKAGDGAITSYMEGQSVNDHVAELKNGVYKGYVTDHLGSVLNNEAAGPNHRYSIFGAPSGAAPLSFSSDPASFSFAGGMLNRESGNTSFGWRDLHHDTGRWGQQDPLGFAGRDTNLYRYVNNAPGIYVDPFGLKLQQIWLVGIGNVYLDDAFIPLVTQFIASASAAGADFKVTSGFRSTSKQTGLNAGGAKYKSAAAGTSLHEAGFAIDINFDKLTCEQKESVKKVATKLGLGWGGDFKGKGYDPIHFYLEVPGGRDNRSEYIEQAQEDYEELTNP